MRRGLAAAAAAAIVVVLLVILIATRPLPSQREQPSRRTGVGHGQTISGSCPTPFAATGGTPDLDQLVAKHPAVLPPSSAQVSAAVLAVREFMGAYDAYTYAQAPLSAITDACPRLLAQLRSMPPVVPASERALHPRVVQVAQNGGISGQVALQVTVSDGHVTYPVDVTAIEQPSGDWLVTLGW